LASVGGVTGFVLYTTALSGFSLEIAISGAFVSLICFRESRL